MKIERAYPPNYKMILKAFPMAGKPGVIFTYGDTIFNPAGTPLTRMLLAHEEVHSTRQGSEELKIMNWWQAYINSLKFRFDEELPAHIAEYKAYRPGKHGFSRAGFLSHVANRLSGPLYGHMLSFEAAAEAILHA